MTLRWLFTLRVQTCGREAENPPHPSAFPERAAFSLKGSVLGSAEPSVAIAYFVCGFFRLELVFFFENLRATAWELWLGYSAHRLKLSINSVLPYKDK